MKILFRSLTDYFFWFAQPSSSLNVWDRIFVYLFGLSLVAGLIVWVVNKFSSNKIVKKLFRRIVYLTISLGIAGVIWFGFRYENTPIFAKRFWVLVIIVLFAVWKLWILRYLIFDFSKEKHEFDQEQIKNKYLSENKRNR